MRIIEGETSERKSVNRRERNGQTINLSPLVSLNEEAIRSRRYLELIAEGINEK